MSNRIYLDHVRLTYPSTAGNTLEGDEGWLLQDDYQRELEFVYDNDVPTDDLELLRLVQDRATEVAEDLLQHVQDNNLGMYINSVWYNWYEIEHIWEEVQKAKETTDD